MAKLIFSILISIFLIITLAPKLVYAFGYDNPTLPRLEAPTAAGVSTTNYSTVNVNNSLYWQGHTGTDGSWLTGINASLWSTYPAISDVDLDGNAVLFDAGNSMYSSGGDLFIDSPAGTHDLTMQTFNAITMISDTLAITTYGNMDIFGTGIFDLISETALRLYLNSAGVISFNANKAGADIQMYGQSDNNTFYLNSSSDRVGIGTASPSAKLEVNGNIKTINLTATGKICDSVGCIGVGSNSSFNQSLTDILYAKYNFTNNNFNGSGSFTTTGIGDFGTFVTPYNSTYIISPSGGDYTTIQSALNAHPTANTLFLVYPGIYAGDTINFTANSQSVIGMGTSTKQVVSSASSTIVDFGAYNNSVLNRITVKVTGATSAIATVTGSTGSIIIDDCTIQMTNSNVATVAQPACIKVTGTANIMMLNGFLDYTNNVATTVGGGFKVAILPAGSSHFSFRRTTITLNGAGASEIMATVYGEADADIEFYRCTIEVTDLGTTAAIGFDYINGASGDAHAFSNYLHVAAGAGAGHEADAFVVVGTKTVRSDFNHIHLSGNKQYPFQVDSGSTANSHFDDIISTGSSLVSGTGVFNYVNSITDGSLRISGLLNSTGNIVTTGTITGNLVNQNYLHKVYDYISNGDIPTTTKPAAGVGQINDFGQMTGGVWQSKTSTVTNNAITLSGAYWNNNTDYSYLNTRLKTIDSADVVYVHGWEDGTASGYLFRYDSTIIPNWTIEMTGGASACNYNTSIPISSANFVPFEIITNTTTVSFYYNSALVYSSTTTACFNNNVKRWHAKVLTRTTANKEMNIDRVELIGAKTWEAVGGVEP